MEHKRVEGFLFELVSPEKLVFSEKVLSVTLPSSSGYLTVMAGHAPLMADLMPGTIRVLSSSGERLFALGGGVVDITSTHCSLLAEVVIAVDNLSFDDLEQRMMNVRATLETNLNDTTNYTMEDFLHQLEAVGGISETK
ncbi:ATP synthase F1 subunit epsilon [Bartonella ancashensis]|uniref:ATP synthase epsilon chain n=1 Tax=Bartonella ancashensis TaxID=1318743 RepID=A0A0M4LFV0_9HYPH|nr:ATP synthase F1 subunit epsilon [Bartonella ancashensis]ALE03157.1 ATP synthase epsilon chain [Bartonella ancashensis]